MIAKSKRRILVVEDEQPIRNMVRYVLERENFLIMEAGDVREAERVMADKLPHLILLDWMLPDTSGVEMARRIRQTKLTQDIPVIMLTARAEEDNKIKGLEAGADDYVTKPFSPQELTARIKAVLRRGPLETPEGVINVRELYLNVNNHKVKIEDQPVKLGPTEYQMLYFFLTHQDRVYSREHILNQVWGGDVYIEERTVDVHIRRLRKILEPFGYHKLVQTVRGAGYRFSSKTA